MKYSRLRLSACLLMLFILALLRLGHKKARDMANCSRRKFAPTNWALRSICGITWWMESSRSACAMRSF